MIAIIDYGLGNPGSIQNMLKKLKFEAVITSNAKDIEQASHLIIPGVGSFDRGMENMAKSGLQTVLNYCVLEQHKPVLGICLGMQMMCRRSEEGQLGGLGWMDAVVKKFTFDEPQSDLKIPHIGWADVNPTSANSLFKDLEDEARFYFVHSYYIKLDDLRFQAASCHYGFDFTAAFQNNNLFGVQFHPEKSHAFGMKLLRNFVEWGI